LKRLLVGSLVLCMVLGFGSFALAQTGTVSVDQWFANHTLSDPGYDVKLEASARLTGISGEVSITDKLGVAGSFVFGKSDDFKVGDITAPDFYGELSSVNLAVQYQIVPMVKARAGLLTGSYIIDKDDKFQMTGITLGAALDAVVGDGIGVFGEAVYAPIVNAKYDDQELKDSSMMAFEAGGTYSFGEFAVKGGYRYQGYTFKAESVDEKLSSTFSGLFLGVGFHF
jgi:hypothetical protein